MYFKIIILALIVFLLAANSVQAIAVKIQPSEIEIETKPDILIQEEIIIENPDNNVALYEVYVDNFSDWIKIKPESFTLESGGLQKIILKIKNKETGIFSTMISVVARPLSERKFKAGSGVKIPLKIKISKSGVNRISNSLIWILYIIFSCSLLLVLFLRKKKKLKI